jgi:tyrosine-protein kinase Etk/Wzc
MAKHAAADLESGLANGPAVTERRALLQGKGFGFLRLLIILAKRKSFILKSVCAGAVVAVVVSLLLPATYTANAKILTAQLDRSISLSLIDKLNLPGVSHSGPSDIYVAELQSETVANRLIDRFSLMKVYGAKLKVEARHTLAHRTEISAGKDSVISISVDDRDPQRAADLANAYLEELETLAKTFAVTEAGMRRRFFERQVKVAREDLVTAEQALRQTEEKTGLVLFDLQTMAIIEASAALRAQIAAQEIQMQSMRSFATPDNPYLVRAEHQFAALREQEAKLERGRGGHSIVDVPLENLPKERLEYGQRLREARYRETLLALLTKQYETAKLDETRADLIIQPVVQALDKAVPPERRSAPHRFLIILSATLLALLLAVLAALFMENRQQRPKQVQLFRWDLQDGQQSMRKPGAKVQIDNRDKMQGKVG